MNTINELPGLRSPRLHSAKRIAYLAHGGLSLLLICAGITCAALLLADLLR